MEKKHSNTTDQFLRGKGVTISELESMNISESTLQQVCVAEFSRLYPSIASKGLLFHVPNQYAGKIIKHGTVKANGVCAGVSDLILLVPKKGYGCLCIELKTPVGVSSPEQRAWGKAVESVGQKYVVCKSVKDFIREVNSYLR